MAKNADVVIGSERVPPGERRVVELEVANLYTRVPMSLPVHVVNGRRPGPRLFLCAAIHGDELNGVEIIRRVLRQSALARMRGTLLAIPVVNVFGIRQHSRYLPDRRDLNRSFPGSPRGSLAGRLAHIFVTSIVQQCTHGIDLHTAALHRTNLPQIRGNLDDPETLALAEAFGVPVLINANIRDGSLRQSAAEHGVPVLVYEAGEALRFDQVSVRAGVTGVLRVMRSLGMLAAGRGHRPRSAPFVARSSSWMRAPASGTFVPRVGLGEHVERRQLLGTVTDPSDMFDGTAHELRSQVSGIVIGMTRLPLVNEGDALFHVATFEDAQGVASEVESFQQTYDEELMS